MMPNTISGGLHQLIHSLTKAEKRNFKLFIKRNSGHSDLKVTALFDAIDKMEVYDEELLLRKSKSFQKQQLSNLKTHLYKQILASLRLIRSDDSAEFMITEMMDHARILYQKGLYNQSLKILERVKTLAKDTGQTTYLVQAINQEKIIETLHITRSMQGRAAQITKESREAHELRFRISKLSDLALQLYSHYIQHGFARTVQEERSIEIFFRQNLPQDLPNDLSFYEKLYLQICKVWLNYIKRDFLNYYRHAQKWVDLMESKPPMMALEMAYYIKGMHNLINALFNLRYFTKHDEVLKKMERLAATPEVIRHKNYETQLFIYVETARLNQLLSRADIAGAVAEVSKTEKRLQVFKAYMDKHRTLVFNYRFATIYFCGGEYEKALDYLHIILNEPSDLREDLQCYARLLHLLTHYELGNHSIIESLARTTYKYMAKMKNLSTVETEVLRFLRNHYHSKKAFRNALQKLLDFSLTYEHDRLESRVFTYLDFISWLEAKLQGETLQAVMRRKYLQNKRAIG